VITGHHSYYESKAFEYAKLMMRPIKFFPAVLICLLISACSTKIAYNYLDWILEWYAEDLVSLDYDQEWQLRRALAKELDWHRKKQLPLYVEGLDELKQAIDNGLTVDSLQKIYVKQEQGLHKLLIQVAPSMAQLLATLSDKQVTQLLENLEDQNQDLEEEYVDKPREKLIEQRTERMTDRVENWVGPLSDSQKQMIEEWSSQIKPTATQWMSNRRAWQEKLGLILRENRSGTDFKERLEKLFTGSQKAWPESYRVDFEYNRELVFNFFVNLVNNLTTEQRQHLFDEIAVLRNQLLELHNQQ